MMKEKSFERQLSETETAKKESREKWMLILTLAFGIALLPPIWAVLAPYSGITTGAVALICAAVYVANGNKIEDGITMSAGFLCGDLWAVLALKLMAVMTFNPDFELFLTLFILGGIAVIIASLLSRFIYLPAWLCGWAIGLTIMAPVGLEKIGSLPIQIGVAMLAGVWYVGAGVDWFQRLLVKAIKKK